MDKWNRVFHRRVLKQFRYFEHGGFLSEQVLWFLENSDYQPWEPAKGVPVFDNHPENWFGSAVFASRRENQQAAGGGGGGGGVLNQQVLAN